MSRARHNAGKTQMTGGVKGLTDPTPQLISGNSKVVAEAKAKRKDGGPVSGKMSAMRLDRPGRKRGGAVGADCSPLSSAATVSSRSDTSQKDV